MASIKQQQRRSLGWHGAALALGLMLMAGSSFGQGFREYSPYAGIATSSTACGIGIGMSSNRPQAAAIGLPILIAGNIVSLRLHAHHHGLFDDSAEHLALLQKSNAAKHFFLAHSASP